MKAIFHPEAHEEMIGSARFYEGKSEGFGTDFLTAVEETTRRIEEFPEAGPIDMRTSGSGWYSAFLSRFFTRYIQTASSSQPLCISIASLVIGRNASRHKDSTDE